MSQSHHATADNKDMTSKDHILESYHDLLYHFFMVKLHHGTLMILEVN